MFKKTNNKNPRISIKQEGIVIVSIPHFYTKDQTLKLLSTHQQWIQKNLEKIKHSHLQVQELLDTHRNEILFFGKWIAHTPNINLSFLKKSLLEYLKTRTAQIAAHMGLEYTKISVRESKTRLGSCSYQNNLSFSLLLVFAPAYLIDYVIVHELSHIVHKNHSRDFWGLVGRFYPQHKQRRKELHQNVRFYIPLLDRISALSS
ncbi:hypothetical protein BKH46_00905 [Helicobacter sp. 12S02634-8]|nr:hypothetical protein BKH46_00905 [Helicobacter sp. 12S02634-8]